MIQHSDTIKEKDPTTYLLRRSFATHLHTLGFPIDYSQYYMGHLIENDILKRSDFNDDCYLFEIAKLLEKHPLNGFSIFQQTIGISSNTQLCAYREQGSQRSYKCEFKRKWHFSYNNYNKGSTRAADRTPHKSVF